MPQQRMDIRMIKDILRLKYSGGLSHEAIARSLSISKGVVAKYLGLAGAAGLNWEATAELDEASLERRLLGRSSAETAVVPADFAADDALGDRKAAGDGLVGEPAAVLESKNVLDHAYVHSLLRHRLSGQKAQSLCPSGGSYATPASTA